MTAMRFSSTNLASGSVSNSLYRTTTGAILIRDGVSDEFMEEALSKIMDASVAYLKQAADMYKAGYVSLAALRENIRNAPKESVLGAVLAYVQE